METEESRFRSPARPVEIIMGSDTDWPTMLLASEILDELDVPHDAYIVPAHRTPGRLWEYAKGAAEREVKVIIAGAGGAAHLPGMTAALTPLPVIGVPVKSSALNGLDSLLSIVQMPKGVPVATMAIGGAKNAGLWAVRILALSDEDLMGRLVDWIKKTADEVPLRPGDK